MANENIEITAYLKTFCGWSEGVRAVFPFRELVHLIATSELMRQP